MLGRLWDAFGTLSFPLARLTHKESTCWDCTGLSGLLRHIMQLACQSGICGNGRVLVSSNPPLPALRSLLLPPDGSAETERLISQWGLLGQQNLALSLYGLVRGAVPLKKKGIHQLFSRSRPAK
jgi:hypothetical protein